MTILKSFGPRATPLDANHICYGCYEADGIDVFVLTAELLQEIHPQRERVSSWKMSARWRKTYEDHKGIVKFSFASKTDHWFND